MLWHIVYIYSVIGWAPLMFLSFPYHHELQGCLRPKCQTHPTCPQVCCVRGMCLNAYTANHCVVCVMWCTCRISGPSFQLSWYLTEPLLLLIGIQVENWHQVLLCWYFHLDSTSWGRVFSRLAPSSGPVGCSHYGLRYEWCQNSEPVTHSLILSYF